MINFFDEKKILMLQNNKSEIYMPNQVLIEKNTSGTYNIELLQNGIYEVTIIGGGGGGCHSSSYNSKSTYWAIAFASGGSGSGFSGEIYLDKGNYTFSVGESGEKNKSVGYNGTKGSAESHEGGNSALNFNNINLITAYGGKGSKTSAQYGTSSADRTTTAIEGEGGAIPYISPQLSIKSTNINSAGNKGNTAYYIGQYAVSRNTSTIRARSVLNNYGYGGNGGSSYYYNSNSYNLVDGENGGAGYFKLTYKRKK